MEVNMLPLPIVSAARFLHSAIRLIFSFYPQSPYCTYTLTQGWLSLRCTRSSSILLLYILSSFLPFPLFYISSILLYYYYIIFYIRSIYFINFLVFNIDIPSFPLIHSPISLLQNKLLPKNLQFFPLTLSPKGSGHQNSNDYINH